MYDLAKQQEWRRKNAERVKQRRRAYYLRNRDTELAAGRQSELLRKLADYLDAHS